MGQPRGSWPQGLLYVVFQRGESGHRRAQLWWKCLNARLRNRAGQKSGAEQGWDWTRSASNIHPGKQGPSVPSGATLTPPQSLCLLWRCSFMGQMGRCGALHEGRGCPACAKVQKDKLEGWSQVRSLTQSLRAKGEGVTVGF